GLIILGRESELTIVDSADRIVTVQKPVDRIVVATTSNGEAIQILKATDRVVGISDHSTLPSPICFPKLSQLPSIGATGYYGPPDYERILSLNTDLVLDYAWQDHYTIFTDKLPESIPVVGFDFINDATIAEEFEKLGYILDKEDEAKEFIDFYEGYVDTMKKRTEELSGDEKPRVYVGFADYDLYVTISSLDQWYQPLLDMAGGMNMAADLAEDSWGSWWGTGGLYPKVDPEWVIEQNPDIILGGAGWGPTKGGYTTDDPLEMKELRDDIISLPELAGLEAVKNGEVYAIHFDLLCGPSFFIAALYYGTWFHPELFGDLDPQATLQEYVDFRGIDFDVYVQGVFVYPPLE
ncbi:MAG: ABC transporter substrate-binding protein, partial [Candidatus Latescibacteria bacterium]|nr:ABC transporter substrate-binding protein [Candidatus Latescibacterota bacterium]